MTSFNKYLKLNKINNNNYTLFIKWNLSTQEQVMKVK